MLEAIRLKDLGVMPGVTDLIFVPPPAGQAHFLEIKPEKGGTLSPAQMAFRNLAKAVGAHWALLRSVDDVRKAFADWGIAVR